MNDYGVSVLEQYGKNDFQVHRTRGAVLCQKEKELYILRPFMGNQDKLQAQQEILLNLKDKVEITDYFLENQEGELISKNKEGDAYTLQKWYEGKECDLSQKEDIGSCARVLAIYHQNMYRPFEERYEARSLEDEYERHNRELRKIKKFIRKKGISNTFEKLYMNNVDYFLERGEEALLRLRKSSYQKLREKVRQEGSICHGEVNQHNFLITRQKIGIVNFTHWSYDIQIADVYYFLRKILEKYSWDVEYFEKILGEYQKGRPVSGEELENLYIRLLYPEKFWKLANYYFSHNKVWISGKNTEKLSILIKQREDWENFRKKYTEKDYF